MNADYELSAGYVGGFAEAVRRLGWLDELAAALSPEELETLARPGMRSWWGPSAVETLGTALLQARGDAAVEAVGSAIEVASVRDFFKITLTFVGNRPEALLGKFAALAQASVRGLTISHHLDGERRARLLITYPRSTVPRSNGLLWKGAIERLLKVSKTPVRVGMEQTGGSFLFGIDWD